MLGGPPQPLEPTRDTGVGGVRPQTLLIDATRSLVEAAGAAALAGGTPAQPATARSIYP